MRFETDYARELLLKIEGGLGSKGDELSYDSAEDYRAYYYAKKLVEAGYLSAQEVASGDDENDTLFVSEITYAGRLFLETVRDDKIWEAAKRGGLKLGSFSLETAAELAKGFIKTQAKRLRARPEGG
jgi:hypothetical protein